MAKDTTKNSSNLSTQASTDDEILSEKDQLEKLHAQIDEISEGWVPIEGLLKKTASLKTQNSISEAAQKSPQWMMDKITAEFESLESTDVLLKKVKSLEFASQPILAKSQSADRQSVDGIKSYFAKNSSPSQQEELIKQLCSECKKQNFSRIDSNSILKHFKDSNGQLSDVGQKLENVINTANDRMKIMNKSSSKSWVMSIVDFFKSTAKEKKIAKFVTKKSGINEGIGV